MLCNVCGCECPDGSRECPRCGKPFYEDSSYNSVATNEPMNGGIVNPPAKESKTSLILGIIAVVSNFTLGCLCSCFGVAPGVVCAIIGLIMGSKEKKVNPSNKSNSIGTILCIVSFVPILLWLIYLIVVLILYGAAGIGVMLEGVSV